MAVNKNKKSIPIFGDTITKFYEQYPLLSWIIGVFLILSTIIGFTFTVKQPSSPEKKELVRQEEPVEKNNEIIKDNNQEEQELNRLREELEQQKELIRLREREEYQKELNRLREQVEQQGGLSIQKNPNEQQIYNPPPRQGAVVESPRNSYFFGNLEYYRETVAGSVGTRFINHYSYGVHVRLRAFHQIAFWLEPDETHWLNATDAEFQIVGVYKTVSYDF